MAGLPRFPLQGSILSQNVGLDRISLCVNPIGNPVFPIGQYVFFNKSSATWYRYKGYSTTWTNDILLIANVTQSNTKIDGNGYPVTAYVASDGSIQVRYYVSGEVTTSTLAMSGSYPTVVIDQNDTYVVWVPAPYVDRLQYAQLCTDFTFVNDYLVQLPSDIHMMNIQVTANQQWFFTFECGVSPQNSENSTNKVYIAFSNPAMKFATTDLLMFTTFLTSNIINEYFVVAEFAQSSDLELALQSNDQNGGSFNIGEFLNAANLTLIKSQLAAGDEYFVVAEDGSDRELTIAALSLGPLAEILTIAQESVGYTLTFLPMNSTNLDEYFVVAEDGPAIGKIGGTPGAVADNIESFSISDILASQFNLQLTQNQPAPLIDLLVVSEFDHGVPSFVLTAQYPPTLPNTSPLTETDKEYFVIGDMINYDVFLKYSSIDYIDGVPDNHMDLDSTFRKHDKFNIADSHPTDNLTLAVVRLSSNLKESISIAELGSNFSFTSNLKYTSPEEMVQVADHYIPTQSKSVVSESTSFEETLQFQDVLDILLASYANFSDHIRESTINVGVINALGTLTLAENVYYRFPKREGFQINDNFAVQSSIENPTINIDIINGITPFTYEQQVPAIYEKRLLTFTSANTVDCLYAYFAGTGFDTRTSPPAYNVLVTDSVITFALTPIV